MIDMANGPEASVGWVSEALPIALRVLFNMNSKFARIVKRADVGKRYDIGL
jgi:hypothetical protein